MMLGASASVWRSDNENLGACLLRASGPVTYSPCNAVTVARPFSMITWHMVPAVIETRLTLGEIGSPSHEAVLKEASIHQISYPGVHLVSGVQPDHFAIASGEID